MGMIFLTYTRKTEQIGIKIRYRFDAGLYNIQKFNARSKTDTFVLQNLQYADDCVILSETPADLQCALNHLYDTYRDYGLSVNTNKTEIMILNGMEENFHINGSKLKTVKSFKYLGSIVSDNNELDEEIKYRIKNAMIAYNKLA